MPADLPSLPIFPLPLVLFPGATLPLHIFEPRYRAMLADCRAGDGRFGIVLATGGSERALPAGHVGCVAELREVQPLPDGRANVVVAGAERFALDRFVDGPAPYHVATVAAWVDLPEDPAGSAALAGSVRATFARVARAARTLADEGEGELPALPDDVAALSFRIAALVDFELPTRQRLLASRSPRGRLEEIAARLGEALPALEARAAVHVGARSNGHGPHHA